MTKTSFQKQNSHETSRLTLEFSRLRLGTTPYIITQLCRQNALEKRSKGASRLQ
jgi:hypothetical protein